MPDVMHHALMICEMHRYQTFWHKTDSVTLHGLDAGDRNALLEAFGEKVNPKVGENPGSMAIMGVEHMNVSY